MDRGELARRLLGAAFADLAGLVGDAERPQFALASGVRGGGAGRRLDLVCRATESKRNIIDFSKTRGFVDAASITAAPRVVCPRHF